eukprot:gene11462-12660_t
MNKNEENEEISKRQGQVKKKTKIKKTKEKSLRHAKIYFNNVPSIKSKIDSIQEIIEEEKPDIVGLVETHLEEHENIHFEDYIIIRRDRGSRGGGILIAIREKFKILCIECKSQNEDSNLESIRILLGGRTKYKVGVIYAPQGNKLRIKELQEVYRGLRKEIEQGQAEGRKSLVVGDFNAKIGKEEIRGGSTEVNRGGRELLKLAKRMNLKIAKQNRQEEYGPDKKKTRNQR